ncbi:MAG: hypothetical protein RLZZ511_1137 [Cyanobacteriota bacterium]|jgi:hypothetical protein
MFLPNLPPLDEQAKSWLVCAVGLGGLHLTILHADYHQATQRALITGSIFGGAALVLQAQRSRPGA